MALITCPECGNSVSEKAKACPHCGYPIYQHEEEKTFDSIGESIQAETSPQRKISSRAIITISLVVIAIAVILVANLTAKGPYDDIIVQDCKAITSALKNPKSFTLYDDVYIYTKEESHGILVYIKYGATNSYGGMVSSVAIFENGTFYVGDYENEESDFNSQKEYDRFLLAKRPYFILTEHGTNRADFETVSAKKIEKILK